MDEAIERLAGLTGAVLIGIDGLPCSGKSTLVDKVMQLADVDCVYLDDFVRPETDWPSHSQPHFPFEYIRYDEFVDAVRDLATTGARAYYCFDWETKRVATEPRHVDLAKPVIIEGVSALNTDIAGYYGLRVFIESDRSTILQAAAARGIGPWAQEWEQLFLPSADLYMRTRPQDRADLLVAGRGVVLRRHSTSATVVDGPKL